MKVIVEIKTSLGSTHQGILVQKPPPHLSHPSFQAGMLLQCLQDWDAYYYVPNSIIEWVKLHEVQPKSSSLKVIQFFKEKSEFRPAHLKKEEIDLILENPENLD